MIVERNPPTGAGVTEEWVRSAIVLCTTTTMYVQFKKKSA